MGKIWSDCWLQSLFLSFLMLNPVTLRTPTLLNVASLLPLPRLPSCTSALSSSLLTFLLFLLPTALSMPMFTDWSFCWMSVIHSLVVWCPNHHKCYHFCYKIFAGVNPQPPGQGFFPLWLPHPSVWWLSSSSVFICKPFSCWFVKALKVETMPFFYL